jgi:glycosyltransferase involved in cell wall biosynthesis
MLVSCICVCHNKPALTHEAIQSIVNQSYPHWEAVIVDSGVLYDTGYYQRFPWRHDPRIQLIRSHENDEIRRTRAMAPWCYNECLRQGLVSGDLIMYLCDDDLLYTNAFATFVSFSRQNPDAQAMYASQDVAVIYPNGWRAIVAERRATRPGGRFCNGRRMDCHVDYLQLCHKPEVLGLLSSNEYWPESKDSESHADGIFMERIGEHAAIYPIDVKVSQNRRTPQSVNVPVRSFATIECMANGVPFLATQTTQFRTPASGGRQPPDPANHLSGNCPRSLGHAIPVDAPLITISLRFDPVHAGLGDILASLTSQTYPNLEFLAIVPCGMSGESAELFEVIRRKYPGSRLLYETGAEKAATRDRGLWEARGAYFIPLDADTLACPDMVERLAAAMRQDPQVSAMTCYVLGLSPKNTYGSGIFRVDHLRAVGGYAAEPDLPGQDWIGFLKLVNAGYAVDILPEHLFYFPFRASASGVSQDDSLQQQNVLPTFFQADRLLAAERVALWSAFAAMQAGQEQAERRLKELSQQNEALRLRCQALRYRLADRLATLFSRVPFADQTVRWLVGSSRRKAKSCS